VLAPRLAKTVVMTGAAPECTATLAIGPGDPALRIVSLTGAGMVLDSRRWESLFDLVLAQVGESYAATSELPDLAVTALFTSPDRPWERIRF
jgi:hypothetical protein